MMKPNMRPMFLGSKPVPRTSPRPAIAMHASGTSVMMIHQCSEMWAVTPAACTTEAIGSTMAAEMMPCTAPDSTLAMATSQIGQGACTRSSISRVKPNSCAIARAIDCTPWNMIEIPTTPGTRMAAKPDSAAVPCPPMPCPIFGKSERATQEGELALEQHPSGRAYRRSAVEEQTKSLTCPSVPQLLAREVDEDRLEA